MHAALQPAYPMLVVHACGLYIMDSAVRRCTTVSLKSGYYDSENLVFFDSECRKWKLSGVDVLGGDGWFFGYNLFFNRRLKVKLTFAEHPDVLSFDTIINELTSLIESMKRRNFPERRKLIQKVRSTHDMPELLKELIVEDDYYDFQKQTHPVYGKVQKGAAQDALLRDTSLSQHE